MLPWQTPLSDYSEETPIDQTAVTGALRVQRPSLLPWILLGVVAGLSAAGAVLLLRQLRIEKQRADEQAQLHANETARAEKAELALTQAKAKVDPLIEQIATLTVERDELQGRVRTLTLESAKGAAEVKPTAEPAPAPKAPAKKAAKKKKPVKKKRR